MDMCAKASNSLKNVELQRPALSFGLKFLLLFELESCFFISLYHLLWLELPNRPALPIILILTMCPQNFSKQSRHVRVDDTVVLQP